MSDEKARFAEIFNDVEDGHVYEILRAGEVIAVIIPVDFYLKLKRDLGEDAEL